MKITRRQFVQGAAGVSGVHALPFPLRFLEGKQSRQSITDTVLSPPAFVARPALGIEGCDGLDEFEYSTTGRSISAFMRGRPAPRLPAAPPARVRTSRMEPRTGVIAQRQSRSFLTSTTRVVPSRIFNSSSSLDSTTAISARISCNSIQIIQAPTLSSAAWPEA